MIFSHLNLTFKNLKIELSNWHLHAKNIHKTQNFVIYGFNELNDMAN